MNCYHYHIQYVCVFLTAFVVGSNTSCQDVDHAACISMLQQNPHMCQDAVLGRPVCPNVCNKCPLTCYSCHTASYDVSACNKITCNQHQICMVQSTNETGPFTLGCATDTYCDYLDEHAVERGPRSTVCCDTDLCNTPISTIISHVLQRPYPECPRDIFMLYDQSDPLAHNWADVKTFLTDIISTMDIGPNVTQTRVALVPFDGRRVNPFALYEHERHDHNKTEILVYIQTLLGTSVVNGYMANIGVVYLDFIHRSSDKTLGYRTAAPDVPIFITGSNGLSSEFRLAELRQHFSNIITIGIGNITDKDSVRNIATDGNHAIFLNTTAELVGTAMERRVLHLICGT